MGARCFVAGTAVFHAPDPAEAVRRLHTVASTAISVDR
jgi:pentose-5-phosphate-3-epimerase